MPKGRRFAALLAMVLTAGCDVTGPAVSVTQRTGAVADSVFLELAYGDSVDALRRYETDITYAFSGFYQAEDTVIATATIHEVAHAAGLSANRAGRGNPVNFLIYWFPQDSFPSFMPNQPPHFVQLRWNDSTYELIDTVIFIRSDAYETTRYDHALEQIARGFGLRGPGQGMPPSSVFRKGGSQTEYDPADLAVVGTLYDNHLRTGMTREEAAASL